MKQNKIKSEGRDSIEADDLAASEQGYAQELLRRMSGFWNFAISFR